jgi:hypothetical protein
MAFTSLLKYENIRAAAKHRARSVGHWNSAIQVGSVQKSSRFCSAIKLLFASMNLLKTTRGFSRATARIVFAPESWPRQPMLRQKLFRLAALTLQCAGLTTLESSSASEPGRNTVLQASNGRWGSYRMAASYFNVSARRGRSRLTF